MRDTLGTLRQHLEDIVEDQSQSSLYDRLIIEAIGAVAREYAWPELNARTSYTVVSGALTEPPLNDYINDILLDDGGTLNHVRFEPRMRKTIDADQRFVRYWYTSNGVSESGAQTKLVNVATGSKTVTQDPNSGETWYASTDVGSRLVLAGHRGIYEVTAVGVTDLTIYPSFRGAQSKSASATVDPEGERQYLLWTRKDELFSGDIVVDHQKIHPHLYSDDDPLLFDAPDTIRARINMHAARQNLYDVTAERLKDDYADALRREIGIAGRSPSAVPPVGHGGGPALFQKRGRLFGPKA